MNKLVTPKRVQIVKALVEGNSLRSTARMADVAFNTVLKLLPEIGAVCAQSLPCRGWRVDAQPFLKGCPRCSFHRNPWATDPDERGTVPSRIAPPDPRYRTGALLG